MIKLNVDKLSLKIAYEVTVYIRLRDEQYKKNAIENLEILATYYREKLKKKEGAYNLPQSLELFLKRESGIMQDLNRLYNALLTN